jgi:hypothetical protein
LKDFLRNYVTYNVINVRKALHITLSWCHIKVL